MKRKNLSLSDLTVESYVTNLKDIRGGVELLDIDFDLADVTKCCPEEPKEPTPVYGPTLD